MIQIVVRQIAISANLAKLPLCLLIGCSALLGFALSPVTDVAHGVFVTFGIILISAAGACLNCCQEANQDGLMSRTKLRPIPSGRCTVKSGLIQAIVFAVTGVCILLFGVENHNVAILALFSLFLYNSVYTPLKKKSVFAIVPGAICGCMPPVIGWVAGGGDLVSYSAFILFTLFLLWQIPHFWLIVLHYREDYFKHDLPSMLQYVSKRQLELLVFVWVVAMAAVIQLIAASFVELSLFVRGSLVCFALFLEIAFFVELFTLKKYGYKVLFILLNTVLLACMLLVIADRLLL